jgi:hypothetical protein
VGGLLSLFCTFRLLGKLPETWKYLAFATTLVATVVSVIVSECTAFWRRPGFAKAYLTGEVGSTRRE